MENRLPAVLGGQPQFRETLPVVRPCLPPFAELQGDFQRVFQTGMLTTGEYLRRFEEALARTVGVDEAVCVSSGTVGLVLLLRALEPRGSVLLPSYTFMSTGHAVLWNQLEPVFCEVDPLTWNIDPGDVEQRIDDNTGLIIGVHIFGNPAAVDRLQDIADRHRVPLIFDAAHGFGSAWAGRPVGQFGVAEVFSLSPTKTLISGEGGVITTNDRSLADELRKLRNYGNMGNYDCHTYGLNGRMTEFQAILGLRSLDQVEQGVKHRNSLVDLVKSRLSGLNGIHFQQVRPDDRSTYKDLSIRVFESEYGLTRNMVAAALSAEGIDTRPYFDPPLHEMTCYKNLGYTGTLPATESLSRTSLTLPLYSDMDMQTAASVANAIKKIWDHRAQLRHAWELGDWHV